MDVNSYTLRVKGASQAKYGDTLSIFSIMHLTSRDTTIHSLNAFLHIDKSAAPAVSHFSFHFA